MALCWWAKTALSGWSRQQPSKTRSASETSESLEGLVIFRGSTPKMWSKFRTISSSASFSEFWNRTGTTVHHFHTNQNQFIRKWKQKLKFLISNYLEAQGAIGSERRGWWWNRTRRLIGGTWGGCGGRGLGGKRTRRERRAGRSGARGWPRGTLSGWSTSWPNRWRRSREGLNRIPPRPSVLSFPHSIEASSSTSLSLHSLTNENSSFLLLFTSRNVVIKTTKLLGPLAP